MDSAFIAPIVNFATVVGVLVYSGRKPVSDFLTKRSQDIASSIAEGQKQYSEAEGQLSQWEKNWSSVEAHAQSARLDAQNSIARYRESALAAARHEADRIRQDSKLIGQSEATKARKTVEREVVERSITAASNYLRTHVEDADRTRLVGEYLEKLTNGKT